MFFGNDDEDQDFLSPTGGSKLASLFGMDKAQSTGGNESLTYTAPKEPKKKKPGEEKAGGGGSGPSVLQAAVVHAYKYVDGKYASQGKLGAALLGNTETLDYKILLYVSKQQQITNAAITPSFTFTVQANNYVSFYDDARQSWSVMFEKQQALLGFAKQITLAKANLSVGSLDAVVVQDLVLGDGGPLESGDSAEIRYTGWLHKDNTFGPEFDSNATAEKLFRFKLGKGKVIKGWEDGILGMKKNGQRLLVVPPALAYGSKGMGPKLPPNSTLIFEVELVRVKLAKEYKEEVPETPVIPVTSSTPEPAATSQETSLDGDEEDADTVKARTKSISEQLSKTSEKTDKAKLISRMAKMGQPMLPKGAIPADSDVESQGHSEEATSPSPGPEPRPVLPPKPSGQPQVLPQAQPQQAMPQQALPQQALPQQPIPQPHHPMGQPAMPHVAAVNGMGTGMMPGAMIDPMGNPVMGPQPSPAVFQGVAMPSQMAVYQPPQQMLQQGFQSPYGPAMYPQQPYMQPPPPQAAPQQAPASGSSSSSSTSELPVLMSETRQQNTEVRIAISKVTDKIDRVSEKLDHLNQTSNSLVPANQSLPPNMEAAVLLHNIQRIILENDHLKKDVFEKSAKIEAQNEKVAELLQRNQKYVEQSNTMLEQRNDSFKNTASATQSKVLVLEQEKVQLATDLSSSTSQLTTLQLEISSLKKKELDLRQQLEETLSSSQNNRDDINKLRAQNTEYESQLNKVNSTLKDERQLRKQAETNLSSHEEELADLRTTRDTLERTLTDRKKKASQEKKRLEEEIDELKSQHEEEVAGLKEKLRKTKNSTDAATAEQVAAAEEEVRKEWSVKSERLLASVQTKHQRALQEVQEEKLHLEGKVKEMEEKFANLKSSKGEGEKQVIQLEEELDEYKAWKDKYDTLRAQAGAMKERYETRLREVEEEKDKLEAERERAVDRAKQAIVAARNSAATAAAAEAEAEEAKEQVQETKAQAKEQVQRAKEQIQQAKQTETTPSTGSGGEYSREDLIKEVKKIMNTVYRMLREQFSAEKSYSGKDIHDAILKTIKTVTLQMVASPPEEEEEEEEEESEEEESEEEDSEEEEVKEEERLQANRRVVETAVKVKEPTKLETVAVRSAAKTPVEDVKETVQEDSNNEVIESPEEPVPANIRSNDSAGKQIEQESSASSTPLAEVKHEEAVEPEILQESLSTEVQIVTDTEKDSSGETHSENETVQEDSAKDIEDKMLTVESIVQESAPQEDIVDNADPDLSPEQQGKLEDLANQIVGDIICDASAVIQEDITKQTEDKEDEFDEQDLTNDTNNGIDAVSPGVSMEDVEDMIIVTKDVENVSDDPVKVEENKMQESCGEGDKGRTAPQEQEVANEEQKSSKNTEIPEVKDDQNNTIKSETETNSSQIKPGNNAETKTDKKSDPKKDSQKKTETKDSVFEDPLFGEPTEPEKESVSGNTEAKTVEKKNEEDHSLLSTNPPPLFDDDDDDAPLFGNDDNVADTFGFAFAKKKKDEKKEKNQPSPIKSVEPKKVNSDSEDDSRKPPPPPLFGDDEEDDDLDWLN